MTPEILSNKKLFERLAMFQISILSLFPFAEISLLIEFPDNVISDCNWRFYYLVIRVNIRQYGYDLKTELRIPNQNMIKIVEDDSWWKHAEHNILSRLREAFADMRKSLEKENHE